MSNRTNAMYIGPIEARKAVERKYCGALLINESACALDEYKIGVI